jgi:hypothetical protein
LFGGLRIFAMLDYKGGNYMFCAICSIRNRWNQNSWAVAKPRLTFADTVARNIATVAESETHIMPADFIKLREVSLSYTIPRSLGGPFERSRWTITLSGRNLWLTTKYEGMGDPEVSFYSSANTQTFLDYASFPQPRRLSASVSVTF